MKKISAIFCASAIALALAGCTNGSKFAVEGTADAKTHDGNTVYLYHGDECVDSTVVANGRFSLQGTVDEPWLGHVTILNPEGRSDGYELFIERGHILLDADRAISSGTPLNDQYTACMERIYDEQQTAEMRNFTSAYYAATDAATRSQAERSYDSVEALVHQRAVREGVELYRANTSNILGARMLDYVANLDQLSYAELQALVDEGSEVVKGYEPLCHKMAQMEAVERTSAGKHYTDIQGVGGRLSDLIDGKLALVDFYASWCGPCRNEIRDNLVPLWAKYQRKGLVIVGLNVWERGTREQREAAHAKVMADLGITYPQLVDSTRTATETYGVRGIPQIMLISPDGTILARDLRGAAIEEAIVKALQ